MYNAFTTPFRTNTTDPRALVGVVMHADVAGAGTGAFSGGVTVHFGVSAQAQLASGGASFTVGELTSLAFDT